MVLETPVHRLGRTPRENPREPPFDSHKSDPSAGNGFYTYTATGVNFGDGPVEISFDVKASLVGSALHVIYNGNQVFDIQNSLNGSTYTTIKKTYQLNPGFTATIHSR